ncbi:kinetochore-associated protein 1 isoform X3 [Homalodisca vitripennis]|uniref:kinetochore-associated protein 1 isoform X3 n=1 Tax=Homalodisca vitripennis TaxID=197043 RepID=UPI001EEB3457|nr:kinetochore-associated protein 1 isoform X3 [Homalodisca vitripennis]
MHTMVPRYLWKKTPVKDLVVLEGSSVHECNLLALVDSEHEGVALISMSRPDFKVNYTLPVGDISFLVNQKGSEEILFLEGFGTDIINTIRVKAIVESQPDLRLQRILRRGKFEEAEKFARAFSLDLEIVYKAHVQRLSQDLSPWSSTIDSQKNIFSKILEIIEKIKDHHFVAEICVTAIPPNFDMLHTMLMYGMERFSKVEDKCKENLSELLAKVSTIARRMDTCMLIHGSATTVDHWIEFPKHDLVISCLNHINRDEIKESILIWSRHLSDMKPLFTMKKAEMLMSSIPKSTKLQDLLLWLHHFVPPILSLFPNILINVVDWAAQRVKDLEAYDSEAWPDSGLKLAKCLLKIINTPYTEKSILLQSQRVALRNENLSHQSPQNRLLLLIDTLEDINILKKSYGVNLLYNEFVQEDHSSFVAVLFERLPLENISLFMVEFFPRLMMDRELDPDTQILQFIQDIVTHCEDWWYWEEAPWEAIVTALVPHINSIQTKLDAILHVLNSAPVPWTATVAQLAEQGVRLPHYRASEVYNECNNVPKKLIMKKYGVQFDRKNGRQLVHLILKRNEKHMLEDINEVAKCVKGNVTEIYLIVLIHLIEHGEDNKVWQLLKSVDKECKEQCISRLIFHIKYLMERGAWDKISPYLEFMPVLEDPKEKQFFAELRNMYTLKTEFDITTSLGKVFVSGEREKILENQAEKMVQEIKSGSLSEPLARNKICRLAFLLHMTVEEGIIALSSHCVKHNLQLALSFLSIIEDLKMKPPQVYTKISALIGQLISVYKPTESPSMLIECFSYVTSKVTRQYRTYSESCQFDNICCWMSLLNRSIGCSKAAIKPAYGDPAPTPTSVILVHSCIQNMIYCFFKPFENAVLPVDKSASSFLSNTNEVANENREIMLVWQRLREEQQDLTCIRLMIDHCWSQKIINPAFIKSTPVDKFLTQSIKELLKKLFRMRNFDLELALSLLHYFSKDEALDFLVEESQSVGYNYQRLSAISQLALTYCEVNKIDKLTKKFKKHHMSCKWAKKLNELGLPYKDAFKDTDNEHKQLISKLISLPSITIPLLKEFCLDMFFDLQECLMMYLEYLLLNWQPDMRVTEVPSSGDKVMVVKNSKQELLQQCRAVLHQLGTKAVKSELGVMTWNESIQNGLCNFWNKVNYYYYEVYFVLAELYQNVLSQQVAIQQILSYQGMLEFLQSYTRISAPSETEQEQWFQLFPNTNHLPPISQYRLPFIPFCVKEPPWSTIKPELSLKTYKIWYDIIPNLGLDRDMLCTLTIQRLTSDQLAGGSKDKSGWRLQTCNNSVLQDIQECVRHIRNQEMASAALYYVVNHMPPGADQMAAAKLCYLQAETWLSQDFSEKAKAGFAKVQKKYLTVCTSHILHSSGLGKPEYLELVLHPQELICALYDDSSILQRKTGTLSHCPDINSVVLAIGQLHRVNVVGIQQELLSEWLYPADSPPLDSSCDDITQNIAAIHSGSTVLSDNDSIIRACYVLESMELETAAKYLVSYAGELECRPTAVRLRALQCLCTIATADIVVTTTGRTLDSIKGNMQNLMFISELEKLGLVWSVKGFESCDKEDVMRILLMKASPHAVQLAAALGYVFKLINIRYWDQTLQLMTSYAMVEELVIVLPELTHLCHLLDSNIFTGAWNCALITPLQKAEYPLSKESGRRVQRSLEMLYCCPIPRQVNLLLMLEHCQRLHSQELISRLEPFLSLTQSNTINTSPVHIKQEILTE